MTDTVESQAARGISPGLLLLIVAFLIAGSAVFLTFGTMRWIGHAVTASVGLVLLVVVIISGAVQKGRIRVIHIPEVYRFHRTVSTGFGLFVIATYSLGILTTLKFGGQLIKFPHGIVGLVLLLMVLFQLVPSILIRKRAGIQALHRFTGYAIVPVFLAEITIGLTKIL